MTENKTKRDFFERFQEHAKLYAEKEKKITEKVERHHPAYQPPQFDPWEDVRPYLVYGQWWITKRQDLVQFIGPSETSFLHKNSPKSIEAQLLAEPLNTIWHLLPEEVIGVNVKDGVVIQAFIKGLEETYEYEEGTGLKTILPDGITLRPEWAKTSLDEKFIKLRD